MDEYEQFKKIINELTECLHWYVEEDDVIEEDSYWLNGKAKAIRSLEKTKAFMKQQELQELCATAYQVVGAAGGPVELLDNLSAASVGTELPHNTEAGLPWMPAHDIATDKDIKTLKDIIEELDLNWRTRDGNQYADARSAEIKSLKHILEIISK